MNRTEDRSLINFRSPTREGNLALVRAGVDVMMSCATFSARTVLGPLDDRTAAVAGLYVSGPQEEVDAFYARLNERLAGRDMEFTALIAESEGRCVGAG